MNPIKMLAGALLGLLHTPSASNVLTLRPEPHQNPVLNSIRFRSKFVPNGPPPASYNRRNQRKIRKNFRRAIAAGY